MKIILASGSPRRKMLFENLGLDFRQVPSRYEEDMTLDMAPEKLVEFLSLGKAEEVASREKGLVVACDTMVFFEEERLGKPKDRADCLSMIQSLSGSSHYVISGVTIIDTGSGRRETAHERTEVHFRKLSDEEITRYVDSDEPYDKAGGYAIQGHAAAFIEYIEGCYTNVVGFPVPLFLRMLEKF